MRMKKIWVKSTAVIMGISLLFLNCESVFAATGAVSTVKPQAAGSQTTAVAIDSSNQTGILNRMIQAHDTGLDYFTGATLEVGDQTVLVENQEVALQSAPKKDASGDVVVGADFFDSLPGVTVQTTSSTTRITGADASLVVSGNQVKAYEDGVLVSTEKIASGNLLPVEDVAERLGYEAEVKGGEVIITKPYQTERIIVKSDTVPAMLGAEAVAKLNTDTYVLQFDSEEAAARACGIYNAMSTTDYAEPDVIMSTDGRIQSVVGGITGNHKSWGAASMGFDAYNASLGSNLPEVVVAVLDTGCDMDHSFLSGRLIDSGVNLSSSGAAGSVEDDHGHGTHVTGTIVDCTAANVKVMPFKVLNAQGSGASSAITSAIYTAVSKGAKVINLSLSVFGVSASYDAAINDAVAAGVAVCVAAGNDASNTALYRPAGVVSAFTVSAVDSSLNFSPYSNYGNEVDYSAPGTAIVSSYLNNTYATCSGTSMATPHIAAACAAIFSSNPSANVSQVEAVLDGSVQDLGTKGFDIYYGVGFVVLSKLIPTAPATPVAPVTPVVPATPVTPVTPVAPVVQTAAPVFGTAAGSFTSQFNLTITAEAGAAIYVTLDGSTPTQSPANLYGGPVSITATTTVKAIALASGKSESPVISATYNYIASLANAMVVLGTYDPVYNGAPKTPGVTIPGLALNVDFTVTYASNILPGKGIITITGTGKYTGVITRSFDIQEAKLNTIQVGATTFVFDGLPHTLAVTGPAGSTVAYSQDGLSYGASSPTITNVGSFTIYYRVSQAGFTTVYGNRAISVTKRTIGETSIALSQSSMVYTGTSLTPTVTISYKSRPLTKDVDYTVGYSKNVNVGTATVNITGKGNFAGSKTVTFAIKAVFFPSKGVLKSIYKYSGQKRSLMVSVPAISMRGSLKVYYKLAKSNYNTYAGTGIIR